MHVLNFLVTFLLLTTNTALFSGRIRNIKGRRWSKENWKKNKFLECFSMKRKRRSKRTVIIFTPLFAIKTFFPLKNISESVDWAKGTCSYKENGLMFIREPQQLNFYIKRWRFGHHMSSYFCPKYFKIFTPS